MNWYGRFLVESNLVFHVNERLTMGGTLEKIGATTTNAVDGLALDFGTGGKLAVAPAATGTVAAYGLYNKRGAVTLCPGSRPAA